MGTIPRGSYLREGEKKTKTMGVYSAVLKKEGTAGVFAIERNGGRNKSPESGLAAAVGGQRSLLLLKKGEKEKRLAAYFEWGPRRFLLRSLHLASERGKNKKERGDADSYV